MPLKNFFSSSLLILILIVGAGCSTAVAPDSVDPDNSPQSGGEGNNNPELPEGFEPAPQITFTAVGETIDSSLIDLEFLPSQGGEAIVITQDGNVYYLDANFNVVGSAENIDVTYTGDERGLLNVVADPGYATNGFIYLYYTDGGSSPDRNQVERYTVNVNVGGNTFSLSDGQVIIAFDKTTSATNHNGGSMVFMTADELAIGVGDGGNTPETARDLSSPLGKIHRIIPNRTPMAGSYSDPGNGVSGDHPSIYSIGLRNPFTLVVDGEGDLFVGDVGAQTFEEINCVYYAGEDYFWPDCEGPCPEFDIINPIHGYAHDDADFDPDFKAVGPKSIMVSSFYQGDQYGGAFTGRIIYNDFFDGFVRLLTMTQYEQVIADEHIGTLSGLTGLHEHPVDGLLYGVSLFGEERVLRLDLAP